MSKILRSLLLLGFLGAIGFTVTKTGAWFTDQEQVLGNTVSTGTIDISLDGENPVSRQIGYSLADLKPSQHGYITEIIGNVGSNPANIYKSSSDFVETELLQSEPKCQAIGGSWDGSTCSGGTLATDLADHINYDLRVEVYNTKVAPTAEDKPVWWETIYLDSDNKKLGQVGKTYLGMLPAGWYMKVIQSYHMVNGDIEAAVDNKYQGEKLNFSMTFDAEQLKNTIPLENKYEADGAISHHLYDGISGSLSYTVRDVAFDYTVSSTGVAGDYTLIAWDNSAKGYSWNWSDSADAIILAHVSGGSTDSGSVDINRNLINAKFWLVPGNFGTIGQAYGSALPWNATQTLFETGLGDYYDANL